MSVRDFGPTRLISNLAIHPGELLAEEIELIGMTQSELAERMSISVYVVSEIIQGKRDITDEVAAKLEEVLGSPAHMWVNSQARYDFTKALIRDREENDRRDRVGR